MVCRTFKCNLCHFETKIKTDFMKHQYWHEGPKKRYCSYCNYSSSSESNVRRHEKAVHGDKFYCDICEKEISYLRSKSLEEHKEQMHSKKHFCSICGKLFTKPGILNRHIRKAHSENLEKRVTYYNCGHCPYKSQRRTILKRHMDSKHLKIKPPKQEPNRTCETCSFTFTRSFNLKDHFKRCKGGKIVVIF